MDEYLSEREQIDKIRVYLKENAAWLLIALALPIGGYGLWNRWHAYQSGQSLQAQANYTHLLEALSRGDTGGADKLLQGLHADYGRTPYVDQAELAFARFELESDHYPAAEQHLSTVMNDSKDPELRLAARLRLARVERAAGHADQALKTLDGADPQGYGPAFADVRGDALLDRGDKAGALAAYQQALKSDEHDLLDHDLLALKIEDLGGTPDQPTIAAAGTAP